MLQAKQDKWLKPIFLQSTVAEGRGGGGTVVQSVERATPGEDVQGSIPAVAALLVGSVSV